MSTNGEVRRGARRSGLEWPTILLIVACYSTWMAAGLVLWPAAPFAALAIMTVAVALQSSLMHEASHGHPTRSASANELLVGLPIGLIYPYRRFKTLHLRHHADERLTDPFDDPESYYRAMWQHRDLPAWLTLLLRVNNTMAGRFLIGPAIANAGFLISEARLISNGDWQVSRAWLHHAAGLVIVFPLVGLVFGMPFWAYLIPVYLGQSLISVRTFASTSGRSDRTDARSSSSARRSLSCSSTTTCISCITVADGRLYRLPALFRERRAEWLRLNGGYVYPGYLALLRDFAFRAKEPVVIRCCADARDAAGVSAPHAHAQCERPRIRARPGRAAQGVSPGLAVPTACRDKCAMNDMVAALPMYDWPKSGPAVDALWRLIRDRLRDKDIPAPRSSCSAKFRPAACSGRHPRRERTRHRPDPATLPPESLDLDTLCDTRRCFSPRPAGDRWRQG